MRNWDSIGLLRIGASITIGAQFLPSYVKAFYHRHPGIEVNVTIAPSHQLEQALMNNKLDFTLIEGTSHNPAMYTEEYMEDRLSIIASPKEGFQQGQKLTLVQFRQQRFLLREMGSGTREVFDRAVSLTKIQWIALTDFPFHAFKIKNPPKKSIRRLRGDLW